MKSLNSSLPILHCECGDTSIVDNPIADIRVIGSRECKEIDGVFSVVKVTRKYYASCPTCGKEIEIPEKLIPEKIRKGLKVSTFS